VKKAILRRKDIRVLSLIVESYLRMKRPVSSGYVADKFEQPVSPAAVRYIMAKLEKWGFLRQPHPSAGRIPTDKGLRLYVNHLFDEALYEKAPIELSPEAFSREKGDLNSILDSVSRVLSDYSNNLGFVLSPRIFRIQFRHIRLVKVSEQKILIILITTFHLVLTEIVETRIHFTQVELDRASLYLNENFRGKSLLFVRDFLLKELPEYRIRYENLLRKLISLLRASIQEEEGGHIYIQGTSKLLEKPGMFDTESLKTLFQKLEEKAKLARLLSDVISLDRVKVLIGSELDMPNISDCSLILSHYGYDRQVLGSLGIIGPKWIPYRKIIPLVDSVAKKLSETIRFV